MANRTQRRPPLSAAQSLGSLPPRQVPGLGGAFAAVGASIVLGAIAIYLPDTGKVWPLSITAMVIAVLLIVFGVRAFRQQGKLDPGIEAVLPLLGAQRPTRDLVKASRWKGGWIGEPTRVLIRYAAFVNDEDPRADGRSQKGFLDQVVENFSRRMDGEYRAVKHDQRKCIIVLELAPPSTPRTKSEERAEKVVRKLFGDSANVDVEVGSLGEVAKVSVKHDQGPRFSAAVPRAQAERVYSSMLPGRWRAKWDLETDKVVFEIRPPMKDMVLHEPEPRDTELTHSAYKEFRIPIGVDEDGYTQYWHPAVSPHCLVIGGTGSGKTSFQHTVLTHFSQALWRVWVLDGKRIEFAGFRTWSNVELVAARVEHQVRMLQAAHDLMEQRYTQLENGTARLEDFEPLALIIDEYATFKARVIRWYATVKPKGAPAKPPVLELLSDLARLARSAKIHLLLGIQRPDAEFLGGEMRDNFGARLSLGRLSPQGAMMMWDSPAIGVAIPRNKRGRGVTLNADSLPVEVQTYYTPDPAKLDKTDVEEWEHLKQLTPTVTAYPRRMIVEPEPLIIDDEEIEADYFAWTTARITQWDASLEIEITDEREPDVSSRSLPSNVVALGARRRPVPAAIRFEEEPDEVDDETSDEADGYGEVREGGPEEISEGDLLLVDASLGVWGVVESIEPDVVDEEALAVEYRDPESGEAGLWTVPDTEVISYRSPILEKEK